jgi:hypothetical protein
MLNTELRSKHRNSVLGGGNRRPQVFENAGFDPNEVLWARVCKNFGESVQCQLNAT